MSTSWLWAAVSLFAIFSGVVAAPASAGDERMLRKQIAIAAPLDAVWSAWTTVEGLEFISGRSRVELRVGGPYEWFLDGPADERGRRGGEGARVLAFLPMEMLAFDWTFSPAVPSLRLRDAKTQVVIFFEEQDGGTHIRFVQHGWGEGEDWDRGYEYFDRAWDTVLQRLKEHLESGAP